MVKFDPERYGKPERLEAIEYADVIEEISDLATTANVELPGLAEAAAGVAGGKAIVAELSEQREKPGVAADRIARSLIDGEVDLEGAARELALVEAMAPGSLLAQAVRRTTAKIPARAFAEFSRRLEDEDVVQLARKEAAETREEIIKLRPALKGIHDAEEATQKGTKAAAAWAHYRTELLPRYEAIHELIGRLRKLHLVAPLPLECRMASMNGRYDKAEEDAQAARRAGRPVRKVLDEVCDAWISTGPHTEEEVVSFCRQVDEDAAASSNRRDSIADAMREGPRAQSV